MTPPLFPSQTKCSAKQPDACRYHGNLRKMVLAVKEKDISAYVTARIQAEESLKPRGIKEYLRALSSNVSQEEKRNELDSLSSQLEESLRANQKKTPGPKKTKKPATNSKKMKDYLLQAKNMPKIIALDPDDNAEDTSIAWHVASDEAPSNMGCNICGHPFTKEEILTYSKERITCKNTGEKTNLTGATLTTGSMRLLADKEAVKDTTWYHATTNPNWDKDIIAASDNPLIHLGTPTASFIRGRDVDVPSQGKVYYFKVSIKEDAPVNETVTGDPGQWPPVASKFTGRFSAVNPEGVQRYINYYEQPGSISLISSTKNLGKIERMSEDITNLF